MTTTGRLIAAARKYVGTRYLHGGRTADGMDCLGPIVTGARDVGILVLDAEDGYGLITGEALLARLRNQPSFEEVPPRECGPGCVAVFWLDPDTREPQHVALVADGGVRMIHCWTHAGRVAEHDLTPAWRRRMTHCFKLRGGR